jgi:ribosomal protein L7/L12
MAEPIRQSDIAEADAEQGFYWLGGFLLVLVLGFLLYKYGSQNPGGIVLMALSPIGLVMGIRKFYSAKHVPGVSVECPYCRGHSNFLDAPKTDFTCAACHRRVAVDNGRILDTIEVKCGFCGTLQKFSERTEVALCEECDREIPLATSPTGEMRHLAKGLALDDDARPYDLILRATGTRPDETIAALQHILALNRIQVKEILERLPATLLTGIPKRKAQMLQEDLRKVGARTEMILTGGTA